MKNTVYLFDTVNMPEWAIEYIDQGYSDCLTERDTQLIDNYLVSFPVSPGLVFYIVTNSEETFLCSIPEIGPHVLSDCFECNIYAVFGIETAKTLASNWHGGQWSPLYSFASTGQIVNKDALLAEISQCLAIAQS